MLPSGDHAWLMPLYYPRHKIVRARELLGDLQTELNTIVENNPFLNGTAKSPMQFVAVIDGVPQDDGMPEYSPFDYMAPPARAAMLIGDILHNLRSSLDLLACELVTQSEAGSREGVVVDLSGVAFPFPRSEQTLEIEIAAKRFNRAGVDAVELYRTLTPWEHGNRDLWALHQLNILDKHRSVLPHTAIVKSQGDIFRRPDGSLFQVMRSSQVSFTLPKDVPLGGEALMDTLRRLADMCDDIVSRFEALPPERRVP